MASIQYKHMVGINMVTVIQEFLESSSSSDDEFYSKEKIPKIQNFVSDVVQNYSEKEVIKNPNSMRNNNLFYF